MKQQALLNQINNQSGALLACFMAFLWGPVGWLINRHSLRCPHRWSLLALLLLGGFVGPNAQAQADKVKLSVDMAIDNPTPAIGSVVTYTVAVTNTGSATATGVVVSQSVAVGYSTYLSATTSVGTFSYVASSGLGTWTVGRIDPGRTVTMLFTARVDAEGVAFNAAEVQAVDQTDANSSPGNNSLQESDYDNACFSVPIAWYAGDEYTVDKPTGFSAVSWLADGQPITASTPNASVDAGGNLIIKGPGTFSFMATLNGCPTGNCCNIVVTPGAMASLGDFVFEDTNADGVQQAGEPGIAGVIVTLYRNGTAVTTTTTDAGGLYSFTGLTPGTSKSYVVGFTQPAGYTATAPLQGGNPVADSDADPTTGRSVAMTLTAGQNNTTIDAGYYKPASIGDYVFEDNDRSGTQNAGDTPVEGVTVTLYRNGAVVATTTTDANGLYSFTGLTPGHSFSYSVGFALPTNYTTATPRQGGSAALDSDAGADPLTGRSIAVTLTSGESNTTIDAGLIRQTAGLGDFVFEDTNGDGVQQVGEPGLAGVVVTLFQNGNSIKTATTDANGLYSFTGLTPNTPYQVGFGGKPGYTATAADQGGLDALDSDAGANGLTGTYSLSANEFNTTVDAGYVRPASIGDYVFEDKNKDGVQSAGDTPIPAVVVTLYQNGSAILTTTTDANGLYSFTGLTPGTSFSYSVGFAKPAGFDGVAPGAGTDPTLDSDADSSTGRTGSFTLSSGQSNSAIDAGFSRQTAGLGDIVFEDKNANGLRDSGEPGIAGIVVTLYQNGSAINTTTTDANGLYSFTGLTPNTPYQIGFGAAAGYTLTKTDQGQDDAQDSDAGPAGLTGTYSLTANEFNRTVDAGLVKPASLGDYVFADNDDNGVQSVGDGPLAGVTVTLFQNGSAVQTTTTNANGLYSFTGLTPGSSNSYSVGFTAPTGYSAVTPLTGANRTLDSDAGADPLTGRSIAVTLTSGESNTTVDAGYSLIKAGLGDYVFYDKNKDGIQNGGDTPLDKVLVTLFRNGTAVATTQTDARGYYAFTGLTPGTSLSYSVGFATPDGLTATAALRGGNDALDSDADTLTGRTRLVTLAPGEFNANLDAGYQDIPSVPNPVLAKLGAYVFEDKNKDGVQDAGDKPLAGVTVTLFQNGSAVATVTTDSAGRYLFTGLLPGPDNVYQLKFAKPTGFDATSANVGTDPDLDSDADPLTGVTQTYTLTTGESNTTVDAGYIKQTADLGDFVFDDQNRDGRQTPGEPGIPGVVVTLYLNGPAINTTTTDASGLYSFTGLTPGSSNSYVVGFGRPSGFEATSVGVGTDDALNSDADPLTGRTRSYTLTAGEENETVDAGFFRQTAGLGNYVFEDKNANGVQDVGDTPMAGVLVTLYHNGSAVQTTTTDVGGAYSFTGLSSGAANVYRVGFAQPTGYGATLLDAGGNDESDSDLNPTTGQTGTYTLTAGQFDPSVDAGFIRSASLGDYAFVDNDNNGVQSVGDSPLAGVTVTLYRNGTAVTTTTTDAGGLYSFTGLTPGTSLSYSVGFTAPTGYSAVTPLTGANRTLDSDAGADPATGRSRSLTLSSGESNTTIDAGYTRPSASLGDYVFNDRDGSNTQTTGDMPIAGVTVTLYRNGTVVTTTATNASGFYSFTGLTPGNSFSYSVGFSTPAGFTTVTPLTGGNTALDSDNGADPTTGRSIAVTLTAGESNTTIDAGFRGNTGSIGNYVWFDYNNDGRQGDASAEPGVQGVTVQLFAANNLTTPIATTTTNGAGNYLFDNLVNGQYVVKFTPVAGSVLSTKDKTNVPDDVDSDALATGFTDVITINVTQPASSTARNNPNIDAGIVPYGSIGDYVWRDANDDGIQNDGPTAGVPNVTVQLFGAGDLDNPLDEVVTDGNGRYLFDSLITGNYVVKFILPTGSRFGGRERQGDRALDSDAATDGFSRLIAIDASLAMGNVGRNNLTVDAGLVTTCATPPVLLAGTSSLSLCGSGVTSLTATAPGAVRISWYASQTATVASFTTANAQSATVSVANTVTYYAEAETAEGCRSDRFAVTILVSARPNTPAIVRETTVCLNQTFNLTTVQPTSAPTGTLEWRTGNSETSPLVTNLTAVAPGTYYLFDRSAQGCYSLPAVLTVNGVNCACTNVATLSTTLTAGTACAGEPLRLIATIGGSATAVTWAVTNPATGGTLTSGTSLTATYRPSAADVLAGRVQFTVTTNDPAGECEPVQSTVIVALNARPGNVYNAACDCGDQILCRGNSTKLVGFADNGRVRWTNKATGAVVAEVASGETVQVTPMQTTTYVASAIGLSGCNSLSAAEVVVTVGACLADLAVAKEVMNDGPYKSGDVISYGLTAMNNGPVSASAVTVTDLLPAGMTFVSATPRDEYNATTGVWTVGTLTAGSDRSLVIQVRVTGTGHLVNNARITGSNDDPAKPQNNTASVGVSTGDCSGTLPPTLACAVTALCGPTEVTTLTLQDCLGTPRWSNGQTGSSIVVVPGVTTVYTASCVVGSCTLASTNSVTVSVTNVPAPTILASAEQVCAGGVVSLTATGCEGGTIYWSDNRTGSVVSLTVSADVRLTAQCRQANCYSPSAQKTITVGTNLPKPTIVCDCGTGTRKACAGETVVLTVQNCLGTPRWSTGDTTATIRVNPTATNHIYSVVCRQGTCSSPRSDEFNIEVFTAATPTVAVSSTGVCPGGVVSLSATGCEGTVKWSNNRTGSVISVTMTANTSFYAYCQSGHCTSDPSASVAVVVNRPTAPTIRAIPNTAICSGESVTLVVTEGCPNGTIKWSNTNLTGSSIVVTPGQNTTYVATCVQGSCESAASNEVRVNIRTAGQAPTIAASSTAVCVGGSVTLTAGNCTGGTVIWSNQQQGSSITVTPQPGDVFYAVCRQAGQCGSPRSNTVAINVTTVPTPQIVASSTLISANDSVTLTLANECPGTITWSTNETGSSIIVKPTVSVSSYTATCRFRSCTSEPSKAVTIRVNTTTPGCDAKAGTLIASTTAICASTQTTVSLSATSGGGRVVPTGFSTLYVLTKGTDLVIQRTSATASFTVPASSAGLYTIHTLVYNPATLDLAVVRPGITTGADVLNLIRDNKLCADLDVVGAKTTLQYVNPPIIAGDRQVVRCYGDVVSLTANACANGTVRWSNGAVGSVMSLTVMQNVLLSATCELNGCTSGLSNVVAIDVATPKVPTIGSDKLSVCAGNAAVLTAQGCENGTYLWSTGATGTSLTVTPQTSTTYAARCVIGSCAGAWSVPVSLTVGAPAAPVIAAGTSGSVVTTCFGTPVTLTAQGCVNGGSVIWSNNMVGHSITITPALSATYTAVCCTADDCKSPVSNAIAVVVLPKVLQPRVANLTNTCPIGSVNLASAVGTVTTTGGVFEYYTTADLRPASRLTNTNVTLSGTYYVAERTTGGCYSAPSAIQVQITPCGEVLPCEQNPVTVNAGADDQICAAKTYKLRGATTGQHVAVQWSVKGSGSGTFDNAFSPTALYTPSVADVQAGQVTLVLTGRTSNTACAAKTDEMVLTLSGPAMQPTVAVTGNPQLCSGESLTLSAPNGYTYLWSTGATAQRITVASSGTYTVQVIDANGCSSVPSLPVSVSVAAPVPAPLVANLRNTCPATTVNLSKALSATTVGSTYEFRLGESLTSALVVNPAAAGDGTYYVFERTNGRCVSLPARVVARVINCATDRRPADLAISKMVSNTAPKVGEALTYTLKVTNGGPGKAYNVDIRDVLPTGLNLVVGSGPINYTVANGAILKRFDSLAVGASDSIVFVARLTQKGAVRNIASITYADVADSNMVNNTASVTVRDSAAFRPGLLGLAKSVVGQPKLLTDTTVAVTYRFTLTNYGDEALTNVSVTDDLGAVFGAANLRGVSTSTTDVATKLALNGAYTGTGTATDLLLTSSTLAAGQTSTIVLSVTAAVSASQSYTFANAARATAANATTTVADNSVDGFDADPDRDGDPTNNAGFSTFFIDAPNSQTAQLGVAMAVDGVQRQPDGSYNVTYKVYVKNFGLTPLTNVSLIDSVARTFVSPASFSIVRMPTVNAGSELVVSGDFNGTTAPYYLNSGASRLAAGKQDTLTYVINVLPNGSNGPFLSQVYATGRPEGTTATVADRSNTGALIVPKDDTKTAVRFDLPNTLLGVAKAVGTPVRVDAHVWEVPYTITLTNMGLTELKRVQLVDDLSTTFGNGAQVVSVSVTAGAGLKLNPGYTGLGLLTSLLDTTGSSLPAQATRVVQLTARVNVSRATSLTFTNLAIGSGMNGAVAVSDTSNTGTNVDPDNDLNPRNNNRGTVVDLANQPGAPYIGVAMMVEDTARQANGSYDVTYRVVVRNYGAVNLTNVALSDSLMNTFNERLGAGYTVLGMPIASAGSRLKLNQGFNGGSDPLLVLGDSTSRLAVGATDTLRIKINVVSNGQTGTFYSTVYAVARAGAETVRDMSTNGMNPDLNGNGNPTELTEQKATPLTLPLSLQALFIPEGFSPNGDGINDRFVIQGTAGLTVSLEVFNRWGHRVYVNEAYENDWDGTANTGVQVGNTGAGVPSGTYYYVVRLSDGREFVRYMTISR